SRRRVEGEDQRECGASEPVEGVVIERLGHIPAGLERQLPGGGEPHPRPARGGSPPAAEAPPAGSPASTSGPCPPRPAGRASRNRSSSGPSSPAGVASSFETVALAVSSSWLALLCGPVDHGMTSGAVGFARAGWLSTIAASSREE